MLKANIAVLVSGGGTNLQALIDAQNSGTIAHGEIKCVISSKKEAYALKRAEKAGIKTYFSDSKSESFERKILEILSENNIKLIVLAGFMSILSKDFVNKWKNKIINVHPALIPSFCGKGCYGLRVHKMAIDYGVKVSGATVHLVNEIPDGGRILLQKAVDVLPSDTPETLQKRIMEQAEWVLLPKATEMMCREILQA